MPKHGCGKSEKPIAGPSEPFSEPRNRLLKFFDGKPSSKVTRPFYEPKYSVVELKGWVPAGLDSLDEPLPEFEFDEILRRYSNA